MADVQIAVWLGWKARHDPAAVLACCTVGRHDLADEIGCCGSGRHRFSAIFSAMQRRESGSVCGSSTIRTVQGRRVRGSVEIPEENAQAVWWVDSSMTLKSFWAIRWPSILRRNSYRPGAGKMSEGILIPKSEICRRSPMTIRGNVALHTSCSVLR